MSNSKFIKLTTKYSCLFLLISSFSFSASGCGRKVTKIDTSIKEAYDYIREKNDSTNNALSILSTHNGETKKARADRLKKIEVESNSTITETPVYDFLAEEFFSLYIFSSVDYSLQYAYEPNGVNYEDKIYGNVTNELSESYRRTLKSSGGTTPFYLEFGNEGNDLTFRVDWKRKSTLKDLPDNYNFQGCTYVNGLIKRDENLNVTDLHITSYSENDSHHISSSHFDFKNFKLSLFTVSYRNGKSINGNDLVKSYNHGSFNYNKFKELKFTRAMIATSAITDDYLNLNYEGYLLTSNIADEADYNFSFGSVSEALFEEKFNNVYNDIYSFPVRGDIDAFDYGSYKKVEFLDDVLGYGLDKTKIFIDSSNIAHLAYIEKETLLQSINDYLAKTTDENVRKSLNNLYGEIKNIKDSNYRTVFSNISCSFVASEGRNYWHNAYKGEDFYYCFSEESSNGVLVIRFIGTDIESASFNIKHRVDGTETTTGGEPIVTYEPAEEEGFFYKHETNIYYATCLDCGEKVPNWKGYLISYGYFQEVDGIEEFWGEPIYDETYRYDQELGIWRCVGGYIQEYYYDKDFEGWIRTYSAQLECNENTNYELYPMYEWYYEYKVEKSEDKYTLSYKEIFINNWLKTTTTNKWIDFVITKTGDLSLKCDYKSESYSYENGKMVLELSTSFVTNMEYINVDGLGISLSKTKTSVNSWSSWDGDRKKDYSSTLYYSVDKDGLIWVEDEDVEYSIEMPIVKLDRLNYFEHYDEAYWTYLLNKSFDEFYYSVIDPK